ncbi:MAG: ATP-binding cassette domain-containing protein, partial [Bacillota bacterium]|nr:ATP-binding cassette domain-containing protein [Bacillota bacterium]
MSYIKIEGLTFAYDGSSENIFENLNLNLDTGWRLGFTGRNGRGKTTFLKLLMGELEYSGTIASEVEFDYFPLILENTYLTPEELGRSLTPDREPWELMRELSLLGLEREVFYRPYSELSKGEQAKVQLALLFLRPHRFSLIDEPTSHLDMAGREKVGEYLEKKAGFILVSHDRALLDRCVDHILAINKGNIEVQQGNFSHWYKEKSNRDNYERKENQRLLQEIDT